MYSPSLDEVKRLAQRGNLIPVFKDISADLETPVSAFLKVARGGYSFLLESVEGGERLARYSFIGTEPYKVVRSADAGGDPLLAIQEELHKHKLVEVDGLPRFHGGAVGYLSYDAVRHFERLPSPDADPLLMPQAIWMFTDTLLVFDHLRHLIKVVSHVHAGGDVEQAYAEACARIDCLVERLANGHVSRGMLTEILPVKEDPEFFSNRTREDHERKVQIAKDYIHAGELIQVVLSQRLGRKTNAEPFSIYRSLRTINPSPYMYYLHLDDSYLVGASPELLVRVEDGVVSVHPIAGTMPRGHTPEEDADNEDHLRHDEKEKAEHVMLLDLGRNDVGRVSEPGSVRVTQMLDVERYSHVMHLVSHVVGKLRADLTPFDALRACFPAGTVSGAPKIRAMEIIAELEPDRRGPYAGAVGYFSFSGNLDTAITIRTILLKEGVAYVQAGGGIVADSVPSTEYQETLNKARALLRAIADAERRQEIVAKH